MWKRKNSKAGSYVFPNLGRPCFVVVQQIPGARSLDLSIQSHAISFGPVRSESRDPTLENRCVTLRTDPRPTRPPRNFGVFPRSLLQRPTICTEYSVPPAHACNVALFLDQKIHSPSLADSGLSLLQKRTFRRRRGHKPKLSV